MADNTSDELREELSRHLDEAVAIASEPQPVPVNMYESDEALVLVTPLPGVMADDVQVEVEPTSLRITAAMRTPAPKEYLLHEWHYGPYERRVEIPPGYGGEVTASFGNGQLALRLARGEASGPKVIHPAS